MQRLRGPENRAPKRMRDHDVVSNFDGEQGSSLRIDDGLAECRGFWRRGFSAVDSASRQTQSPGPAMRRAGDRRAARRRPRDGERRSSADGATGRCARPGSIPAGADGCGRRRQASRSLPRHHTSSSQARLPRLRPARAPCADRRANRWHERRGRSRPLLCRLSETQHQAYQANFARAGLMSTSVTSVPGIRPHRYATREPTTPAPMTAMRSAGPGAASHTPLSAVSMLAASTARVAARPPEARSPRSREC